VEEEIIRDVLTSTGKEVQLSNLNKINILVPSSISAFQTKYVFATPDSIRRYPLVTLLQDLRERKVRREEYKLYTIHSNSSQTLQVVLISNQLDAQFLLYIFILILYMFRATLCSSSGESIVSIQHLVYVTLCR
jgi:hypothetical protein